MSTRSQQSTARRDAAWNAEVAQMKTRLENAWREGEYVAESLWHQSAVAALHWVAGNRSRVSGFRQAVKGTPVEQALDVALKAVRAEAHAPAPRAPRKAAQKAKAAATPRGDGRAPARAAARKRTSR